MQCFRVCSEVSTISQSSLMETAIGTSTKAWAPIFITSQVTRQCHSQLGQTMTASGLTSFIMRL